MSLILDALNRSRDDAQKVPGLATSHFGENRPAASRLGIRLLLVALVLALLLIGWLLWDRTRTDESPPPPASAGLNQQGAASGMGTSAARHNPVPPPPEPARAPQQAQASQEPQALAPGSPPAPPAATANTVGPAGSAAAASPGGVSAPAPEEEAVTSAEVVDSARGTAPAPASASVEALYRQQQLATREVPVATAAPEPPPETAPVEEAAPVSMAREEQPVDIEQLLAAAQEELENARLAEHSAPFLTALSQQTKDAIPTLMYQAHDYTGNTADSFVLINGKKLKVGGSTGGVRVDEILPDSVVLSFKGTQFRLRALNSWVNL